MLPHPADPVFVTRPSLPPLERLVPLLEEIWQRRVLTNFGPLHQRLAAALCQRLGVPELSLVANATLGLMLALRHLKLRGEVITTPFSFVATSHAILWNDLTPVFVDVDPVTLNIDPELIERAITPRTSAILAVHCYGRACDVEAIESIARRHGLRVIYDAAHAFGIDFGGRSLCAWGDLSVLSFHATKVFNTLEGGAIVSPSAETRVAIDRLINYGIVDEQTIETVGLNAKMSEVAAALGLVQLEHIDAFIAQRREVDHRYRELLDGVPGLQILHADGAQPANFYAFPVRVRPSFRITRDELYGALRAQNIFARRYFSPCLSDLPMYRSLPSASPENLTHACLAAREILCLPMYPDLDPRDQQRIADIVRGR